MAWCQSPGGSEQHLTRAAAGARTRTQRPGKHLAVHASELVVKPDFQILRRYRRPLLLRLEHTHRPTLEGYVHRATRLGRSRSLNLRIGISQKNDSFPFGDARVNPCNHHALGLFALGPEHLLAVNLVIGDCLLAFVRNEPVDELLAKLLLHMRMLGRVNQDDTVLVEQQFVALHREDEVGLVLERNPRAAVRHHVGSAGCCCVERGTHALPDRFVPRPSLLLDVDAGRLPEVEFGDMGAERSPREMKGAPLALMLCSAKAAFLDPLMLAGSSFGPMMTKSLYITE